MPDQVFIGWTTLPTLLAHTQHTSDRRKIINQCTFTTDRDVDVKDMLNSGTYGETYKACLKKSCKYIAKLVELKHQSELQNFSLESQLAIHTGELGIGPKIERTIVCAGPDRFFGIMLMERMVADVDDLINDGYFTPEYSRSIVKLVHKMHEAGIWHNDLHRANIMFNDKFQFKIIDFGMSWPLFTPVPILLQLTDQLNWIVGRHDVIRGTPKFMNKQFASDEFLEWLLKTLHASQSDLEIAFKWRIYDSSQTCRRMTHGPLASFDMYKYALEHTSPEALQTYGFEVFAEIMEAYLQSDTRKSFKTFLKELYQIAERKIEKNNPRSKKINHEGQRSSANGRRRLTISEKGVSEAQTLYRRGGSAHDRMGFG